MSVQFGNNLRKLRKEKTKYSQGQIAEMLGISRSTYTYYETGKTEPSYDSLRHICEILDVDYNTILDY